MTDRIAAGVLELSGDSSQLRGDFASTAEVVEQQSKRMTQAAGKIGEAMKQAGDQAKKGFDGFKQDPSGGPAKPFEDQADRVAAASKRFTASLEREIAALTLSRSEYRKWEAQTKGISDTVYGPLIQRLDAAQKAQEALRVKTNDTAKSLGLVGITAGQASNAMRQLPSQFTDIFVSLASGQQPLTVFLQQGGQIKDTFGGIGNAVRALGSLITPARLLFAGAAAGVTALTLAYKQGSAEADEYRRALVLTGNAAGGSIGQFQAAADAVSRSVGTQGKAAEVIAQLAATSRIAASDVGKLAEAAIRLEREGGPAVEKTVQAFADLGKEPLKAVERLNETTNFLTIEVYRQIAALEKQGRTAEAAAVAQNAYADAGIERAKTLEKSLGLLERGWRGVTDTAKAAWDAMLNIGRPDTLDEQLAAIGKRLEQVRSSSGIGKFGAGYEEKELLGQQAALQELLRLRGKQASIEAERAVAAKAAIEAEKAAAEEAKRSAREREEALKRAAAEARRFAEAGAEFARAQASEEAGLSADYIKRLQQVEAARKAGLINTKEQVSAINWLIQQQPFYVAGIKAEEAARKAAVDAIESEMKARDQLLKDLDKSIEAQEREVQSLEDQIVVAQFGKEALEARVLLRKEEQIALLELQATRALFERGDAEEYQRLLQRASLLQTEIEKRKELASVIAGNEAKEASAKAASDAAKEWGRTADSIRNSLTDAFRRAFESGEDFGTAMARVIENELKSRVATALSGLVADGLMSFVGIQQGGGAGVAGGATGYAQAAQSLSTLYGYGKSAYSYLSGASAAAAANTVPATTAAQAAFLEANGVTASTSAVGSGASSAGGIGYAGWAAIAAAIYMRGASDYDKGFNRESAKNTGTIAGRVTYDTSELLSKLGVSDKIADIFGATMVAYTIGRAAPRVEAAGVQGTLGNGEFSGQSFVDVVEKGGLLRSDKRYQQLAEVPQELDRFFDSAAKGVLEKATEFGEALGLPVDALASITADIKVKLTDDAEENSKAIVEALSGYGDALVSGFADAVKPLAIYGETTVQTIERVGSAIVGVNDVLDALGASALSASIEGGKAALDIQDLFGGLDKFQGAAGSFLQNFYSEAERAELTTNALAKTLGEFGLQVPATRDAFRGLVQAQDLTTESGREAFTALLAVSDAFASITPAARSAADILAERQGLERELLDLLGDTTAIREQERAALDSSNVALYDQIQALTDQAAAAERAAAIMAGLSSVIGDFVGPRDVATFRAGEVQSTLAGGGITASVEQILGSTRGDIVALWQAVGDEGKAAILEAYGAWEAMHAAILAADIAAIVEPLGTRSDALLAAYQELVPAADDLVGSWRSTRDEVQALSAALAEIDGTAAVSAIDRLRQTTAQRDGLQGVISGNSDRIFDLRVGQGGRQAVDLLRQREAQLWTEFASTNNPEVARAITQATLQRIALEGELQADVNATQIDALKQQISAAERLRDLAAEMGNFVLSLQAGNLSNLGYQGRLAASETLFANSLTTGEDVQGNATSLLQNAQSVFGGATGAYSDVFESVTGRLRGIGMQDFGAQISEAQAQLNALQSIDETADAQIAALTDLNSRFGVGLDSLNTQVQAQTDAVREQVTELRALQANQERQILQFGLALTRLIEASERTATAVESTADAIELEAAAP